MRIRSFFALLLLTAVACNDEAAKPRQAAPPPEPIASDVVYNSAFEGKTAPVGPLVLPDAGPSELPGLGGTPGKAKVVDPGAEPRTKLSYAFAMGKARTVVSTLKLNASGEGMQGAGAQPPIKFTFTVTPKTRNAATGLVHFEVKVVGVDIAVGAGGGAPPEALAQKASLEKAFTGLEGSFDSSAQGDLDNVKFSDDKVPPQVGEMLELLSAAFEIMIVPLPSDPVGVGGKWTTATSAGRGAQGSQTATMTLTAKTDTGATIKVDSVMSAPPAAVNDPQAPPGTTVETKGTGGYTIDVRFDGVASKAQGSQNVERFARIPKSPPQKIMAVKIEQDLSSK